MSQLHLRLHVGSSWIAAHAVAARRVWPRRDALDVRVSVARPAGLQDGLQQIAADLLAQGVPLRRAALQVELGMRDTRIGILRMASPTQGPVPADLLRTYVEGWVQQVLHLDPGGQVVRWQALRDPGYVLVSCVDGSSFAALMDFAQAHELRFTSCIPAAMLAVRQARQNGAGTVLWTEGVGEHRDEAVQMFRFEQGQPVAAWRGWVPPAETTDTGDRAMREAARRFQAVHAADMGDAALHTHWPAGTAAAE